ncbi:hypothetical protein VTJ83DRAFT_4233 [Remersonia thermophila]|uniref:Tafazzin n=1 Tax=Remersonia thermophila TaxID=72144 RepID=A0ABR4D9E4_9PEZI
MPKKRHLNRFSKPPSTAPALLSSPATRRNDSNNDDASSRGRSVNDLLAQLRRTGLNGAGQVPDLGVQPTVPPELRQILNIPETPPPRPRRPLRQGPGGHRLPAGPAPPRSWLSAAERADHALQRSAVSSRGVVAAGRDHRPLPGLALPARRSLLDMVLRRFVADWEWQRAYNRYHLYEIPTHLRILLVAYLAAHHPAGVTLSDLRALLLPPPDVPEYLDDPDLSPAVVNAAFTHLDLSSSLLRSLRLKHLADLLFPSSQPCPLEVQETWDAPDPTPSLPPSVLPHLTHLSLALDPAAPGAALTSWRQLLSLASRLSGTLTHLSLAFWPEPSLTPRARAAAAGVVSPVTGRTVAYGGTGPYSHSLDGDWSEQVLVLRRLSRALYGLEWLDLTGCGAWFQALWESVPLADALVDDVAGTTTAEEEEDGSGKEAASRTAVDWVGDWGKMATLVMFPGYRLREEASAAEKARYWEIVDHARRVERHVRARRAGQGRVLTVETCQR